MIQSEKTVTIHILKDVVYFLLCIKKAKKLRGLSTTIDEDEWEMRCVCKSKNCRRILRDFKIYLQKFKRNILN